MLYCIASCCFDFSHVFNHAIALYLEVAPGLVTMPPTLRFPTAESRTELLDEYLLPVPIEDRAPSEERAEPNAK